MIQVDSVSKSFGSVRALRRVSFSVEQGEVIGLLGPNGAGKTTMMRILSCFMPPSSGSVRIAGLDAARHSLAIRARTGYFLERVSIYPDMRVAPFLEFVAGVKGAPPGGPKKEAARVMELCGLGHMAKRIIGNLSKGYQQRVGLAQALVNQPDILLLDEPTAGIDPEQVVEIRALIKELAQRSTVVFSSHILSEVSQLCRRVIIINRGELLAVDTPQALGAALADGRGFKVVVEAPGGQDIAGPLGAMPGVRSLQEQGGEAGGRAFLIQAAREADLARSLCALAFARGWVLRRLEPLEHSLEETFLKMLAREKRPS